MPEKGPTNGPALPPAFIFRIDEIEQRQDVHDSIDREGKWVPHTTRGSNVRKPGHGLTHQVWWFNRLNVQQLHPDTLRSAAHYSTFSAFFCGGHGFHILRGDATNPPDDSVWHPLRFEHDPHSLSSSVTNTGTERAMKCHHPASTWHHMLLPDIYHGPVARTGGNGGLTGDLPIFLSLIALSMKAENLAVELPKLVKGGKWETPKRSDSWVHKRGVVVSVYAYENNEAQLYAYENGSPQKYYYS